MSKPVKNLIAKTYEQRFGSADGLVVIAYSGIDADKNNEMRSTLSEKGYKVTVVKNTLAAKATAGTPLEGLTEVLDGSCAVVYAADENASVVGAARTLIEEAKAHDFIEIKGAVMEGSIFQDAEAVKALSKYPTREEAIATVAGALLGPASTLSKTLTDQGGQLSGALKGGAGKVPALLKAIEEQGGELKKSA